MEWSTLIHKAAYGNRGLTLENLDDTPPEGGDADLSAFAEGIDEHVDHTDELNFAAEAIRDYTLQLQGMIKSRELTPVMLGIIRQAVQDRAASVGYDIVLPAMESVEDVSLDEQAKVALEGFHAVINNLLQDYVIHFKHHKDVILDFFKSSSGMIAKYEKKTLQNKREWGDAKNNLENTDIRVAFTGLDYFLHTKTSRTAMKFPDFMAAVKEDRAASAFILKEYPKRVLAEVTALTRALRSVKPDSVEAIYKIARAVEKLKTPAELFDKKFFDTELFGVQNLAEKKASKTGAISDGAGKAFSRLAEQAGSKVVGYKADGMNKVGQTAGFLTNSAGGRAVQSVIAGAAGAVVGGVMGGPYGAAIGATVASSTNHTVSSLGSAVISGARAIHHGVGDETGNIVLKTSDIPKVFDAAEDYLSDARAFLAIERDTVRAVEELESALEQIGNGDASDDSVDDYMNAIRVYEQILAFSRVLTRAIQSPANTEMARALRASKYLNYLGLRAIFNAPKKSVAAEGYDEEAQENIRKMDEAINKMDEKYIKLLREHADNPKKVAELKEQKANEESQIRQKFMRSHPKAATEGYDEDAQENIRKMDDELNAHHEHYHKQMVEHADNPKKLAELQRDKANGESRIRQKYMNSHPDEKNYTHATEGRAEGFEGTGTFQVGKTISCNFETGPEVVKVVHLKFSGGKANYLVKHAGKSEYAVAQKAGEMDAHGCYMHCQEVLRGVQNDVQAKEVFGKKVKSIPAMKKEPKTDKQHATAKQATATTEGIAEAWGAALEAIYVKNTAAPSFEVGQDVTVSIHAVEDGHKHMGTEKGKVLARGEGRYDEHYLVKLSGGQLCVCGLGESKDKADLVGIHESRIGDLDEENEAKVIKMFQNSHK
jgi:hypothetical protein